MPDNSLAPTAPASAFAGRENYPQGKQQNMLREMERADALHDSSPSPYSPSSPYSDEIDLLDVARALWNLRFFIFGGAAAGLVAGLVATQFVVRSTYAATVPLELTPLSTSAKPGDLVANAEVIKALNAQMATERGDTALSLALGKEFPSYLPKGYSLESANSQEKAEAIPLIFKGRFALTEKDLPVQVVEKIVPGLFLATLTLPGPLETGGEGRLSLALAAGFNELLGQKNLEVANALIQKKETEKESLQVTLTREQENSSSLEQGVRETEQKFLNSAADVQKFEILLSAKAALLNASAKAYLEAAEKAQLVAQETRPYVRQPAQTIVYNQSGARVARILTLISLLEHQLLFSQETAQEQRKKIIAIQDSLDTFYNDYAQQKSKLGTSTTLVAQTQLQLDDKTLPVAPKIPLFRVDAAGISSATVVKTTKPSPQVLVFASVFLCALLGLGLGFARTVIGKITQA